MKQRMRKTERIIMLIVILGFLILTMLTLPGCSTFDPVSDAMSAGCEPETIQVDAKRNTSQIKCYDSRRPWL